MTYGSESECATHYTTAPHYCHLIPLRARVCATILHRPIAGIIWRQIQKTNLLSLIVEVFGSITYVRRRGKVPHVN